MPRPVVSLICVTLVLMASSLLAQCRAEAGEGMIHNEGQEKGLEQDQAQEAGQDQAQEAGQDQAQEAGQDQAQESGQDQGESSGQDQGQKAEQDQGEGPALSQEVATAPSPSATSSQWFPEDPPSPPRLSVEAWDPQPGKYLLARCLYGRLTNQLFCMRSYMELAQVLNRSLLIPTWGAARNRWFVVEYKFKWEVVVDWKRMQRCLAPRYGPVAVLTASDYLRIHRVETINVSLFAPLSRTRNWAVQSGEHVKEFESLNSEIAFPTWSQIPEDPLVPGLSQPERPSPDDVARAVGPLQDDVITFGEMFNTALQPPPPKPVVESQDCGNLWRCHSAIMEFVRGVGDSKLGGSYAATHLRRGDFYSYLSHNGRYHGKELSQVGFKSAHDVAVQMRQQLVELGVTRLFVATNARKIELELFKAVLRDSDGPGGIQRVITLRDILEDREWLEKQPWAREALELAKAPESHGLVLSLFDKFLCVRASHFFGSRSSTFSHEINHYLRHDEAGAREP